LGQLSHTLLPVFKFLDGTVILVDAALGIGFLDVGIDLVLPLFEDFGVVQDQRNFLSAGPFL
jgi:hypothetical protein